VSRKAPGIQPEWVWNLDSGSIKEAGRGIKGRQGLVTSSCANNLDRKWICYFKDLLDYVHY